MQEREFDLIIALDGSVELQVKGIKGKGCLQVAKLFEQIVGEIKSQEVTTEFYEPDEQVQYRIEQKNQ